MVGRLGPEIILGRSRPLDSRMEVEFSRIDEESVLIDVGSTLDFRDSQEFLQKCEILLEDGVTCFLLNFEGTKMLDSAGLGAIFSLHRRMCRNDADGRILFARPTAHVQTVIRLTRAGRIVEIYETVQEAVDAL